MSVPAVDNLRRIRLVRRPIHVWEVQAANDAADLLEAIDALPDSPTFASAPRNPREVANQALYAIGYEHAMCQVKALLHPPVPAEETLPNTQGDR